MSWFVYSAGVFGCSLWFVRRCFVVASFVGCFLVWFGWVLFSGLLVLLLALLVVWVLGCFGCFIILVDWLRWCCLWLFGCFLVGVSAISCVRCY